MDRGRTRQVRPSNTVEKMANTSSNGAERPCVLVVEDDDAVRRSLQLLLRGRGFDVRAYASARLALADHNTRAAVCLVADLVMPEVDGVALLGALREDGWSGAAILISGFLTPDRAAAAEQAGFAMVLRKPLAETSIVDAVSRAVAGDGPRTAG